MRRITTLLALALVVGPPAASAHVQPSVNENNRGLKLTPLGDRVRLAYTIYFGEVPGAALRRQLDRDRDGQIEDGEARSFGAEIGKEVAASLDISVDGARVPVSWRQVDVGLPTTDVRGGSFAIDLVAVACLPRRGAHEIAIRDDYALPTPGETELKVDQGLGVRLDHVQLGDSPVHGTEVRIRGVGGPLGEGWIVRFTVGPDTPAGGDDCAAGAANSLGPGQRPWLIALAIFGGLAAVFALVMFLRRRRRVRTATDTRTSRPAASS